MQCIPNSKAEGLKIKCVSVIFNVKFSFSSHTASFSDIILALNFISASSAYEKKLFFSPHHE